MDSSIFKGKTQKCGRRGMTSGQVPVDSGVPQGSVLGSLLFLPSVVTSQVGLFADDCLLYRPIRSVADQEAFQCDLEALEQWASTWGEIQCQEVLSYEYNPNSQPSYSQLQPK